MKTKITYILVLLVVFISKVNAQQLALSSQYYLNEVIINPATAGVKSDVPINMNIRRQWTNIKEAPVVQSFSTNGYVGLNLGCGGYILNQVTGPTRRTTINFATAYHLLLDKVSNLPPRVLSFGLAASFSQHFFDINKLTTFEDEDLTVYNGLNYKLIPDGNFGLYFSRENSFFAGASVHHLLQTRRDLFEVVTPFNNGFKRTYYLTGGYNFKVRPKELEIQPSMMFQMIEALPMQIEIHTKALYKDMYWMSLGYRHKDAIIATWGVKYNILRFAYSYDFSISKLRNYNLGSHEISLGVIIREYETNGAKRKKWFNVRNRVDF
jgi:type IX secretion system PorP/SprF family membrane protein